MKPPTAPTTPNLPAPLSARQWMRFMVFWHVVLLGGLALCLGITYWQRWPGLGWQEALLAGLVALQAGFYWWAFGALDQRQISDRSWLFYFLVNLVIWPVERSLAPIFGWVVWAYIGQVLGAKPPRFSLPVTVLYLAVIVEVQVGWRNVPHLSALQVFIGVCVLASWVAVGLFIHRISTTSAERAQLIVELEAAKRELEAAHQRDAELAALRERERLARDLHDSLGHALVTLTVQLEAIQRLSTIDPARAAALIDEMKSLTRSSMEALRRSLANLRAPGLGERSLTQAARDLAADITKRTGLHIDVQLAEGADRLQPAVAEAVWRVAQEGLTNAEKHACAQSASLTLTLAPQLAVVHVTDDGVGLSVDAERQPGHYGLRGLRERVEGLGGTLQLGQVDGKGTRIEVRLPVR
jgi:signal transduction histidine kinase